MRCVMWRDSETNVDLLNYEMMVNMVVSVIKDDSLTPSSIGIFGDWGSGKSSLMKMISTELQKNDNYLCITFNGWLFEGYDDAKTALLGTILDEIVASKSPKGKILGIIKGLYKSVNLFKLIKTGILLGSSYALRTADPIQSAAQLAEVSTDISEGFDELKNSINNELSYAQLRDDLQKFRSSFSELLKSTKIDRLVVFIDELDRCNPTTIIETLEAIRLFLFISNTSYVVGADERHIAYAIKSKYIDIAETNFNVGKEYLEKMIQYPFRIPRLSEEEVECYLSLLLVDKSLNQIDYEDYRKYISNQQRRRVMRYRPNLFEMKQRFPKLYDRISDSIVMSKQISPILTNGFKGNPRQCKRFLNMLEMRKFGASFYGIKFDVQLLVKLMLLEYFSDFYDELERMVVLGTVKEKMSRIEKDGFIAYDEYKAYSEKTWLNNWLILKPLISESDIEPYIYLARDQRAKSSIQIFNPQMNEEYLEMLLSESEVINAKAIEGVKKLRIEDARRIFSEFFERILTYSPIPKNIFKSFVTTAKECSLFSEVTLYLEKLPAKNITLACLPYLNILLVNGIDRKKLNEIVLKWKSTNQKLEKFELEQIGGK